MTSTRVATALPTMIDLPDVGNFGLNFVRTTFDAQGNPRTERQSLTVLWAENVQPNIDAANAQGWDLESINFW